MPSRHASGESVRRALAQPPSPFLPSDRTLSALPPPSAATAHGHNTASASTATALRHAAGPASASATLPRSSSLSRSAGSLQEPLESDGYDYVREVDDNLACPICRNPLVDPVACDTGEHLFCKPCILEALEHSSTCPIDRAPLYASRLCPAPRIVLAILSELLVRCVHYASGCTHVCQRQFLSNHLRQECPWAVGERCRAGCGRRVKRGEVERHIRECPERKEECIKCGERVKVLEAEHHLTVCAAAETACPYCLALLPRSALASHSLVCPLHPTPCPHSRFGCPALLPRHQLHAEHLPICIYEAFKHFLSIFDEKVDALESQNRSLQRKVEELERKSEEVGQVADGCRASLGPYYYPATFVQGAGPGMHGTPMVNTAIGGGQTGDELDWASEGYQSTRTSWGDFDPAAFNMAPSTLNIHGRGGGGHGAAAPSAASLPHPLGVGGGPASLPHGSRGDAATTERLNPEYLESLVEDRAYPRSSRVMGGGQRGVGTSHDGWGFSDAFPESYTPVAAFNSLRLNRGQRDPLERAPSTPGAGAGILVRGQLEASPSTTTSTVGAAPRGHRPHSPGAQLHLNHPGTLTATLHSLASSLSALSNETTLLERLGRVGELALGEASRVGEEVNAVRGLVNGLRMQTSVLLMERERQAAAASRAHHRPRTSLGGNAGGGGASGNGGGGGGAGPSGAGPTSGPSGPGLNGDEAAGLRFTGMALEEAAAAGVGQGGRRWGAPPPGMFPPAPNAAAAGPPTPIAGPSNGAGFGMGAAGMPGLYGPPGGGPDGLAAFGGGLSSPLSPPLHRRLLGLRGEIKL